ncbi:nucleoid-associated protein [Namhaeicola litoreus]|uniref:Nucleoid-associated protein n=1 Tax=Namhaeicola litoreus TaxID=1052145 RepID=A0ABW3Y0W9_9FLAO
MIKRQKSVISQLILHKVGNKFNDTKNAFSESAVVFDEDSYQLMLPFLLKPFMNLAESYRFDHHADINLNELYSYSKQLFADESLFIDVSKNIVKHLYEQSNSANIKTGDVIVVYFNDVEFNDVLTSAIGIFKVENKLDFFQTYLQDGSYDVAVQKGISTKKIDKGCLIINYSDEQGFPVLSVDNNNYDAQYWLKNFLHVKYANDKNFHTMTYLDLCKEFAGDILKKEFGTKEQGNFLAKTVDYFKENDTVNIHDFKKNLFETSVGQEDLFDEFKKNYENDREMVVLNQFHVSELVVKKQKQKFKTEIKLDTHIQIKLDIDAPDAAAEYLENGFDEEKKMKYYKVYYNEES